MPMRRSGGLVTSLTPRPLFEPPRQRQKTRPPYAPSLQPQHAERLGRMAIRTVGVEEELLLVDARTGRLRPVSRQAVEQAHSADRPDTDRVVDPVEQELFRPQIETATSPCTEMTDIRDE